ncbi:MAG TPA: NAD(P)-binding domain-containing protein, partial [Candidatus Deferrimicrobium sp.]|nr:NAD(P)-binding domain-containing protein [Candidatus Deferrimicrobium sp.]
MTETVDPLQGTPRPTLAFIGAGRAGSALARALAEAGHRIIAVHSRTDGHAIQLASATGAAVAPTALAAMRSADLTFATVPDAEIVRVAATIAATGMALPGRSLVHCSATHGPDVLSALRSTAADVGAFHPLQALAGASSA